MKILFYSCKDFEKPYLESANAKQFPVSFIPDSLSILTAGKAKGFDMVSVFTGDDASVPVLEALHQCGVKYIATRAAGYDNIDIEKAKELGIKVANVPGYSPFAIAEHALAMILALNRRLVLAHKQVQEQNFTVGKLVGFDLHGKTIGVIGTGKIGSTFIKMMRGFGCRLIGYDVYQNKELSYQYGLEYMSLEDLCRESDIISIHTCLTPGTRHMIHEGLIRLMKKGVMLINTARGGCIKTEDVIRYLEKGHIGYLGMDVYEKEKGIFFYDWSGKEINDGMLRTLMNMPNVLITPHQAFATQEALYNIAQITFYNFECWINGLPSPNELPPVPVEAGAYDEGEEF